MKTRYKHVEFEKTDYRDTWTCRAAGYSDELGEVAPDALDDLVFVPDDEYKALTPGQLRDIADFIEQAEYAKSEPGGEGTP